MALYLGCLHVYSRRLEDRIRQLCYEAVGIKDQETEKILTVLEELRQALRKHIDRNRYYAQEKLMAGLQVVERRQNVLW